MDALIDELLVEFGIDCHRLDPADREGWCDRVVQVMGVPRTPPQIDIFAQG